MESRHTDNLKNLLNKIGKNPTLDNIDRALDMISDGEDVNTINENGETLFHLLMKDEQWLKLESEESLEAHWVTEKINELITVYGADTEVENNDGLTPMQTLMMVNDGLNLGYKPIKLINLECNPFILDENGNSFLHLYAKSGKAENIVYVKKLVTEYGLDINHNNKFSSTPLDCLMNLENFSQIFAQEFIELGANARSSAQKDKALNEAEKNSSTNNTAQISSDNELIKTPLVKLLNCVDKNLSLAEVEYALEMISDGEDVEATNSHGETLLHILVKNEQWLKLESEESVEAHWVTEKINELISVYGADTEAENNAELTPLQTIMNINDGLNLGYKPIFLINLECSPFVLDKNGNSFVHLYAKSNNEENIAYLKKLVNEYGLAINLNNKFNSTPLDCLMGLEGFSRTFANDLVMLGANRTSFTQKEKDMSEIKKKSNLNDAFEISSDLEPSFKALLNESDLSNNQQKIEAAIKIISSGVYVDTKNDCDDSLLHILFKNSEWLDLESEASLRDHWVTDKIQELTLCHKANRAIKNAKGWTPLQCLMNQNDGSYLNCKPIILDDFGFNLFDLDERGNSLLHLYLNADNTIYFPFITKLVSKYQLDINLKNADGITPLSYLLMSPNKNIRSLADSIIFHDADEELLNPSDNNIQQFENKITKTYGKGESACIFHEDVIVRFFCNMHNIEDKIKQKPLIPNEDTVLIRICRLINKPVNAKFIVRLLEFEEQNLKDLKLKGEKDNVSGRHYYGAEWIFSTTSEQNYFAIRMAMNYVNLWNICHLIYDWKSVENKIDSMASFAKPNILFVIHILSIYNPTNKFIILKKVLKELELKIKEDGSKSTFMETITKEATLFISELTSRKEIYQYLEIFNGAIMTIFLLNEKYNRKYIMERVMCSLDELRSIVEALIVEMPDNDQDNKYFDKCTGTMDEIINFVTSEKTKLESLNCAYLFFHHPYLPQDVRNEITNTMMRIR